MSLVDLQTMRELADAVDKDRGHGKSLLTRTIRHAADEIEVLRARDKLLAGALDVLERLGERDFAHDGSAAEPVDEADCILCQIIARLRAENGQAGPDK